MYCVIFAPGKEPEIWETDAGWPGTAQMYKPADTYVYFFYLCNWKKWFKATECDHVPAYTVPPEYRATVLILT